MLHNRTNSEKELMPLEILLASISYLMTRYIRLADNRVGLEIKRHLRLLAEHPECESEVLKNMGRRLAAQWESVLLSGETCTGEIHSPGQCTSAKVIH